MTLYPFNTIANELTEEEFDESVYGRCTL